MADILNPADILGPGFVLPPPNPPGGKQGEPGKDKTFTAQDLIRFYERNLDTDEQHEVLDYFDALLQPLTAEQYAALQQTQRLINETPISDIDTAIVLLGALSVVADTFVVKDFEIMYQTSLDSVFELEVIINSLESFGIPEGVIFPVRKIKQLMGLINDFFTPWYLIREVLTASEETQLELQRLKVETALWEISLTHLRPD